MLTLDASTTRSHLSFDTLIPALRDAFLTEVHVPLRHTHQVVTPQAQGTSLLMPAWSDAGFYGVKVVNIFPGNHIRGLPGLHSTYLLHDAATGVPVAVLDGNEITSFRTSAASALAASFLARQDARKHLVIGCGRVGRLVARAMAAVRDISSVKLWDIDSHAARRCRDDLRELGIAAEVADDLEAAVRQADIVSCATLSSEPIVHGAWLAPGSHLDLIGSFTPAMQEAHPDCFFGAAVYVDTSEAQQKSGDLLRAFAANTLTPDAIRGDLMGLCRGTVPGRVDREQRTVFKSVGTALEDLVAGMLVYRSASRSKSGQ